MLKFRKLLSIGIMMCLILISNTSCGDKKEDIVSVNETVQVNNSIGDVITKEYKVYYETTLDKTNFTNPKEDKYLGAYIENKVYNGDISSFEEEMGEHSMYVFDFNFNEFNADELRMVINECVVRGAIPYIILTSNSVIYDMKIEDVEMVNDVLKEYDYPMIVELLPYQYSHNYNTDLYKLFYIQAYDILKNDNEKLDIAFPLDLRMMEESKKYMPSEIYFDYLAMRLDVDVKMTMAKMVYLIDEAYQSLYNKPKVLNIGISHYNADKNTYYTEEALEKFEKIYSLMAENYENIVSVNYMDYYFDTENPYPYNERYTLNGMPDIGDMYRDLTSQREYLKKMSFNYDDRCLTKLRNNAIKIDGQIYLNVKDFGNFGIDIKTQRFSNDEYYELTLFANELEKKNYYLILDEENGKITIEKSFS